MYVSYDKQNDLNPMLHFKALTIARRLEVYRGVAILICRCPDRRMQYFFHLGVSWYSDVNFWSEANEQGIEAEKLHTVIEQQTLELAYQEVDELLDTKSKI